MSRKQYTIHYIYKTTNIITGKFYIGMHSTFDLDDGYLGSGKRLRYSINKYGKENHKKEILEFCKNRNELKEREKEIVNENFIKDVMCMNLMEGGKGGFISKKHYTKMCKIGRDVYRKLMKTDLEFAERIKKTHSVVMKEEYKSGKRLRKHFYDWTGKIRSEETKEKIRKSMSGKNVGNLNSQYGTCWIYKNKKNKKIKKEELPYWINLGWYKGRKIKN